MLLSINNIDSGKGVSVYATLYLPYNNSCRFSTDTLPLIYMFSKDRYGKVSNLFYFCKLLAIHLFHIYEYKLFIPIF